MTLTPVSRRRLDTCHPDLIEMVERVAERIPLIVVCGHRSVAEQRELYAQGRTKPGPIVTHIDGVNKKSKHNYTPSRAVDLAPRPLDWNNIKGFEAIAAAMKEEAARMGVMIAWGGDWKRFVDRPHFELVYAE